MNKKAIFIFFLYFLLLQPFYNLIADQRQDNIEIYLVLDKSLSMIEEIESVKDYVIDNIIGELLLDGDYFVLIPFYGKTDNSFNDYIMTVADKKTLRTNVQNIQADGRFTDIGNALDVLRTKISKNTDSKRKYMLLITDGKQEAPPDSPFYSPDGSFNHAFLENTKEIKKEGWKIIVLGVGTESAAKEIAKELSAGYTVVSENTEPQEIEEIIGDFLGRLDIITFNNIIKLDKNGLGKIKLEIESSGYDDPQKIILTEIRYINDNKENINILKNPYIFTIEPKNSSKISIPVEFPISKEDYSTDILFIFEGKNAFSPVIQHITIENNNITYYLYFIIPIIVVITIMIYYSLIIIRRKKMEDDIKHNGAE